MTAQHNMTETKASKDQPGRWLSSYQIAALLAELGEQCDPARIGYYDSFEQFVEKVRSSKHWSAGEVFVYAGSLCEYVVMKQIAPSSCEMLTLTNRQYTDVLTAYQFEQEELLQLLRQNMHLPTCAHAAEQATMTYICDQLTQSEPDILTPNKHEKLFVKDVDSRLMTALPAPAGGWSLEILTQFDVFPDACSAYLGEVFIGSTEV